ncbi:MAG: shikimate dehydrogenase [Mariprofundaceae bacterium]
MFGIIGDPVDHSLSPLFQQFFLASAGLDAVYVPFHVREENLGTAVAGLWQLGVAGFNVTVPHKQKVCPMVGPDSDAGKIGAVNTVKRHNDGWMGTNTDWRGFAAVIRGFNPQLVLAPVLLFGSGGTARAVLHALAYVGVIRILVCNRNPSRLQSFITHAKANYPELEVTAVAWSDDAVCDACKKVSLVVNTTSIGLGDAQTFPFSLDHTSAAIDAVYRPDGFTPFVEMANRAGAQAVDGLSMLVAQGAASFRFWHGMQADGEGALRWLENRLGRRPTISPAWELAS